MPLNASSTATGTLINTFWNNVAAKSLLSIPIIILEKVLQWNWELIFLIFILWITDFILWIITAIKDWNFCQVKFFFWASKILIYWILLLIWISLDESLYLPWVFTWLMFTFILVTDSISILKKLRYLWYDTPMFLEKYLISYKNWLDEKLKDK